MIKVPFLTVVALVIGTSAAFATNTDLLKPDFSSMGKCAYEQHIKTSAELFG